VRTGDRHRGFDPPEPPRDDDLEGRAARAHAILERVHGMLNHATEHDALNLVSIAVEDVFMARLILEGEA